MKNCIQRFVFLSLLIFAFELQAQNFQLTNYSLSNGLPQSHVTSMLQDQIGFIWFGTEGGGVARFDGASFKTWNKLNGLQSNYVNDLKWINGKLFIATDKGLSVKEGAKFINFESDEIFKIEETKIGILLGTASGIKLFDGKSVNHFELNIAINDIESLKQFVFVSTEQGVFKINLNENTSVRSELLIQGDFNELQIHNKSLYISRSTSGISIYDLKGSFQKEIYSKEVIQTYFISETTFWVSTLKKGLLELDVASFELKKRYNLASGFNNKNISAIFKDRQENIWIASKGEGAYKLKEHSFKTLFKGNNISTTLSLTNSFWLATQGGLANITQKGINSINIESKINDLANYDSFILAATDDGLFVLDSIAILDRIDSQRGLDFDAVKKVKYENEKIWVLFEQGGISNFSYDPDSKSLFNHMHFNKSDGLYDEFIKDFDLASNGRMWYVSEKGFFGFIENNKVHHLGKNLPYSVQIEQFLIHDNNLFVTTDSDGIWKSNLSENLKFEQIVSASDIDAKQVHQLFFDRTNDLWIGTQRGIYRVKFHQDYKLESLQYFGFNEGFTSLETTKETVFSDAFDNLYFGTTNGLVTYQRTDLNSSKTKLPLSFSSVEVVYNPIDTINLNQWTNSTKLLNLNPSHNHIAFTYNSVDIEHPESVMYRWRLNNETWSKWTHQNTISFPSLSSGNYIFEVVSKSINNHESESIQFRFSVLPRLIEQLWFQISIVGILLLVLIFYTWFTIKKIKIRAKENNEKLELKHRLLELEHKALQLQMNPHFIFNVLNSIKAMSSTDLNRMHKTIQSFAVLLRDTLNNSRKENIVLNDEIATLKTYVQVEQLIRGKSFDFQIVVKESINLEEILIPTMLLQPFIENAIKHGFTDEIKKPKITLDFFEKDALLFCKIVDNGIGFNQSKKGINVVSHESIAIELSKERIFNVSGKNSLIIKELKNKDSEVVGTSVEFSIPFLTDF